MCRISPYLGPLLALHILRSSSIPELFVALIDGVDLSPGLEFYVRFSQDEFSNGLKKK